MRRLIQAIRPLRPQAVDGFITEELREDGQRMGFWLSLLDGRQVLLAHRKFQSHTRVGPYRVNLSVLNETAVPVIRRGMRRALVLFLDELGAMELSSAAFEAAIREAFAQATSIIATASAAPFPLITNLKARKDVELIPLSSANRAAVEEELTARLQAFFAEDEAIRSLERQADRICEMITSGDVPPVDIEIQQTALRERIAKQFPDKQVLYHLIYESRFRRLWQQLQ